MGHRRSELVIGPSTGWMYAQGIYSISQHEKVIKEAKGNCAEICLRSWDSDSKRIISLQDGNVFNRLGLRYHSLHLSNFGNTLKSFEQVILAKQLATWCCANTALIHPFKVNGEYPTEFYREMIAAGVPLAVENMDIRSSDGFEIEELRGLVEDLGLGFVLDVQHAYEHDPEMRYANDLFEALKDSLVHLHVSGETPGNVHSLTYKADNAKKILEFVDGILCDKNVPLILEGEYTSSDELRQEIEFITRELDL